MHTDFIFAILAEEFGLLGIAILITLFGIVVWRGFAIARRAELDGRRFSAYVCYGLSGWLGLQALFQKIGRESCRGRVWRYLLVSWVAVFLTKKIKSYQSE